MMPNFKFKHGQRVRLKPTKEWPHEEYGRVDGYDGNGCYVVTVDRKYRVGFRDDGLREVATDQLEAV